MSNLERERELADLYRQIQKMQNWADQDIFGYSKEKNTLLNKIWDMRMSCIEQDQRDLVEEFKQFSDQANLEWSSRTKGFN